ncbi:hypothetical protein FVE85_8132 [Porphyridium purpureum]|uniref:DoxX family protein n=1 Tax=Porphyridium purpureum TaxID=35688 RepID=A0A5J4YN74_PORPP|nr:hypothetical protein FVE85_8132 [Porphyridium purpureum]|eukprot:POR2585..scf295_9
MATKDGRKGGAQWRAVKQVATGVVMVSVLVVALGSCVLQVAEATWKDEAAVWKWLGTDGLLVARTLSRMALGVFFASAGAMHFYLHRSGSRFYQDLVPAWLPVPDVLHLAAGVGEVFTGIALLLPNQMAQRYAAILICVLLAVFEVLVHGPMMVDQAHRDRVKVSLEACIVRFILQFVLLGWAYWHT